MSLRLRLAIWYGSLTTIVVGLVCAYSYAIHSRAHYDELDRVLHEITDHVTAELTAEPDRQSEILKASQLFGAGVRVVDRGGRVLTQSAAALPLPSIDVARILASPNAHSYSGLAALAPALHRAEDAPGRFSLTTDRQGNRFRLYVQGAPSSNNYVVAALPLMHIDDAVRGFARFMVVMAIMGGLVAFGVGWLVAQRALRPVAMLTDAAAAIAESRELSRRVADGAAHDELGRLARTFNTMLSSLQDAYDSQVRFVSAASHELRAPLTVLQANLDLLGSHPMSDEERATALAEASAEAGRMTRLVADLLVLARADAGVAIRSEPVELDRVVLEVISEAKHLGRGQRIEVAEIIPVVVNGDRDRLKQLVLNIVENAIKYTAPGGRISVSIRRHDADAVVQVRDTGVGIGSEDLPHVFERFYRADRARSRDPGGSGLGLAIVQWIVAEHRGSIDLASRVGDGTTVTIRLPAAA